MVAGAAEHGHRWLELGLSPSQLEQHVPHPAGYDMALVRASRDQKLAPTHPRAACVLDWRCDFLGEERGRDETHTFAVPGAAQDHTTVDDLATPL